MKKTVFIFPGIGSQHVGMGKEFYQNFKVVRDTFKEASDVLNIDFVDICFANTGESRLNQLENSQLALLTVSVATYRLYMEEAGGIPQFCLGHSLGEYSALCSAGAITFLDTLMIVKERGNILDKAAANYDGLMAWVINLDNKIVDKICSQGQEQGQQVYVSAYDAPKQSSISGLKDDVIKTGRRLEKEGAIVYPLKLTGPFHSPLMKNAARSLNSIFEKYDFQQPLYPVIANHNALPYNGKDCIVDNLSLQLMGPVRWQASVEYILKQGVELAVEVGPDKVLKHLMQKNTPLIRTFSLGTMKDLHMIKKSELNSRN
jgi:[acyl-carrier-protein] S-malonyltransferase